MQINLTPDYSLLAIMVIFLLNYLIVSKFFLRPINNVIEARELEVHSANDVYEQSMARFNEATTQMEEKLHAARHAAADVRDRFRREAAAYRTSVVDKTHNEAGSIGFLSALLRPEICALSVSPLSDASAKPQRST